MDGNRIVKLRTERRQHFFTTLKENRRRQGTDRRDSVKTENEFYNALWTRKVE